jgi:catalase (peroxidase I)
MAALWIRGAFHDAGTYDPSAANPGGADNSVNYFLTASENGGLPGSITSDFVSGNALSKADIIQLGGQVTVTHCGGPNIPFYAGRKDATAATAQTPVGRLPEFSDSFATNLAVMKRMKFTDEEIVAIVTGSHSMGGAHKKGSGVINEAEAVFDMTPGIFDNGKPINKTSLSARFSDTALSHLIASWQTALYTDHLFKDSLMTRMLSSPCTFRRTSRCLT